MLPLGFAEGKLDREIFVVGCCVWVFVVELVGCPSEAAGFSGCGAEDGAVSCSGCTGVPSFLVAAQDDSLMHRILRPEFHVVLMGIYTL